MTVGKHDLFLLRTIPTFRAQGSRSFVQCMGKPVDMVAWAYRPYRGCLPCLVVQVRSLKNHFRSGKQGSY
jgi:hypothetical protein